MESSYFGLEEFLQNPDTAVAAAKDGAVYLSAKGFPEFVLLNYEDYKAILRLARLPNKRDDEFMVSMVEDSKIVNG